jgi:hypothetical protein
MTYMQQEPAVGTAFMLCSSWIAVIAVVAVVELVDLSDQQSIIMWCHPEVDPDSLLSAHAAAQAPRVLCSGQVLLFWLFWPLRKIIWFTDGNETYPYMFLPTCPTLASLGG